MCVYVCVCVTAGKLLARQQAAEGIVSTELVSAAAA